MQSLSIRVWLLAIFTLILMTIAGCAGDDGEDGKDGETVVVGVLPASSATELEITIDEVTVASPPVVSFTATDGGGTGVTGLKVARGGNLRFTIATLLPEDPVTREPPSYWKSYIENGFGQATYERDGVLEDLGNGSYTYTFLTDITEDDDYDESRRHRIVMQIDGFPATNPVKDFRPDGGNVNDPIATASRDIVTTETCNACHNKLAIHGGGRIEIKYCTQCHTPATIDPDTDNTVDFPVMTHKIHMGEYLPSVINGTPYQIIGYGGNVHDYSTVVFPQDIRNCASCHDGSAPQGDNWKTELSMKACGSCHDDIDFSLDGTVDPDGHPGGSAVDNSECLTCHDEGRIAGSVEDSHEIPGRAEVQNYQLKIDSVTGGATPVIEFSVVDPANDVAYDLTTGTVFTGSNSSLRLQVAWTLVDSGANSDFNNVPATPTTGVSYTPASADDVLPEPIRLDFIDDGVMIACDGTTVVDGDWICSTAGNVYTVTKQSALPTGAVGTGRVALEGHLALPDDSDDMPIKSAIQDFAITGTLTSRREIVDIDKCNKCHDQISFHGSNRTDEIGLCVMCHNPSLTDIAYDRDFNSGPYDGTPARPKALDGGGDILYAQTSPLDGKTEESADFKAMIHAIHAGDVDEHGIRENGIQLRRDDFSHVRFPGILSDCTACHNSGTYVLSGDWEAPTLNGVQSVAIATTPAADETNTDPIVYGDSLNDQADDLRISPTAAACSGCHDSQVAKSHMILLGGAVFDQTQTYITNMTDGNFETCSVCHGPGKIADLEVAHGID